MAKILIYCMNYSPEIAGVGKYTGEIGEYLVEIGNEVTVVTTPAHYPGWRKLDARARNWWTKETLSGARVFRCPLYLNAKMTGLKRLIAPASFAITSLPVVIKAIISNKPDIILVVEPTILVAPIILLSNIILKSRLVLHVQDLELEAAFAVGHLQNLAMIKGIGILFDRHITKRFHQVITIANAMSDRIEAKGIPAPNIAVVRNWVDLNQIRPIENNSAFRSKLGIDLDDFVVLYSGNLGPKQGVNILLDAALLLRTSPSIKFVIAGEGPMKTDLILHSKEMLNLLILDFQPTEHFSDFLGIANVHILPQEKRTADLLLPSKLGGMLASGKPIIVTSEAGTEISKFLGQSCILTPPGDAAQLSKAIEELTRAGPDLNKRLHRIELATELSKQKNLPLFVDALFGRPTATK